MRKCHKQAQLPGHDLSSFYRSAFSKTLPQNRRSIWSRQADLVYQLQQLLITSCCEHDKQHQQKKAKQLTQNTVGKIHQKRLNQYRLAGNLVISIMLCSRFQSDLAVLLPDWYPEGRSIEAGSLQI